MAVFSGKSISGSFKGTTFKNLQQFSIDATADPQVYSSSDTAGRKKRVAGVADVTASVTVAVDATGQTLFGTSAFNEGDTGSLILIENSSDAAATTHTLDAFLESITLNVDADSGALVSATATFGGNGTYTKPTR